MVRLDSAGSQFACHHAKTDKGLPQYDDRAESDIFLLSSVEDLVPVLVEENNTWQSKPTRARSTA